MPQIRSFRLQWLVVALLVVLAGSGTLRAASTGTSGLYMPQGNGSGTANGDFVTTGGSGLNTVYRYFIEVPPGLSRLVVEIFDPDIGGGGTSEDDAGRDRARGGSFDTDADYTLIRPNGTTAATLLNCDDNTCSDNVWTAILDSTTATNTAAGHWELRVDESSAATGGDDINAIGVRAHDGTSGSGGTELNVYYDSLNQYGVNPNPNANSRSYDSYPYVTSGCSGFVNDFDYDSNNDDNVGTISVTSRSGVFSQSFVNDALSGNDAWDRHSFTGWTSDSNGTDYGIWNLDLTINTYTTPAVNGNYTTVWVSNSQAGSATPTANPNTNAFRVYLPTDASTTTAPVKTYLEQMVRHGGGGSSPGSGPNPPQVGVQSIYTVTVRVVNPEAQAVTFSSSNLVTANIPGGQVLYGGDAQVSQGSIASQPSVGGSGNITWNPGTLAAGATALLSYEVRVTPTAAGRIVVTATPASGNGTRGTFVDITGNTTQTRATYTVGPLCELAVGSVTTPAVVSSLRASAAAGGGVLVEWQTAAETGTAGFNVYRRDRATRKFERVNPELLAALVGADQGGTYRFVDEEAPASGLLVYTIEEVAADGGRRHHGPYRVAVERERPELRESLTEYERTAHVASRPPATNEAESPEAVNSGVAAIAAKIKPASVHGAHLSVRQTGLYYASTADVAVWLGLTADKASKMIAEGKLALSRDGVAVAYYADLASSSKPNGKPTAQGLFFYGEGGSGIYSTANVYRLQAEGKGLLMAAVGAAAPPPAPGGSFTESLRKETDVFPATVISPDPESDYWFWEFVQGGDATFGHRTFSLDTPGLASGGGSLTVSLQGATSTGVTDEHQASVALNGLTLGEVRWTGISPAQATFPISAGTLQSSGNLVDVTGTVGGGAPYSIFYVDGFDVSYPRSFQAVGDSLAFAPASAKVTVEGFSAAAVRLLDVTSPLQPKWIGGSVDAVGSPSSYRLTFAPTTGARYLAAGPGAVKSIPEADERGWSAPRLKSGGNRADYLVVVPAAWHDTGERLAALRRSQGLDAMVVDFEQIVDEFNFGGSSPHAIRSFLTYAASTWTKRPRYVALAGEGTLDYRNLLGFSDNVLPPLMVQAPGGLFPSDNRLGDVEGDGLLEMAVGRIPVLSAAELDAYTQKIAAYESSSGQPWTSSAVLVADSLDSGGLDFTLDSERIAGRVPAPYVHDKIYLDSMAFADARARLLGDIDAGASFVNYVGHGALDRFSAPGLLTNADVASLANGSRLPVFTAMTCTINRFAVPGQPALGELLVKSASGGAAAVWGPSGLSISGDARLLAERFYAADGARLGDRVLAAVADYRASGGDPSLPRIYDVLGDPALLLPTPPAAPTSPVDTGE